MLGKVITEHGQVEARISVKALKESDIFVYLVVKR